MPNFCQSIQGSDTSNFATLLGLNWLPLPKRKQYTCYTAISDAILWVWSRLQTFRFVYLLEFCNVTEPRTNQYVGPPYCRAEMYACRAACCPLVSHGECADGTHRRTDGRMPNRYITLPLDAVSIISRCAHAVFGVPVCTATGGRWSGTSRPYV